MKPKPELLVFGLKATVMVHDCPVCKFDGQSLNSEKGDEGCDMLLMFKGAPPVFVNVALPLPHTQPTGWPISWHSKCNVVGLSTATGFGKIWHVNAAEPLTVVPFPAADAVILTGPPTEAHVAAPVFASTVAMFLSEDTHCAGRSFCARGA